MIRPLLFATVFLAAATITGCASKSSSEWKPAIDPAAQGIEIELIGRGYTGMHGVADWGREIVVSNSFGRPTGLGTVSGLETAPRPVATSDLGTPSGMLGLKDGRLLVCDTKAGMISLLAPNGSVISTVSTPAPWNIGELSRDGDMSKFAVIHYGGEMRWMELDGDKLTMTDAIQHVGDFPFGVTWHPGLGDWLVTLQQKNEVLRVAFPTSGKGEASVTPFITGLTNPEGIAVDDAGRIWVAETAAHRVAVYSEKGKLLGRTVEGELRFAVSLCASADGTVLVACGGDSGKVYRLKWAGK